MEKMNKSNKTDPDVAEPTEIEIEQIKKLAKDKYNIVLPKSDAKKIAQLITKLDWWDKVGQRPESSTGTSEKLALAVKELVKNAHDGDITTSEAHDQARSLLVLLPLQEKQRLADEIRAILIQRREVLRDSAVMEKIGKLVGLQYGLKLTSDQLEQLIQYLSKKVWYEEGLDESLEGCLDDLLIYVDKRKRGKRVNGLNLHDKIRQALDLAINDLRLTDKEFEPLFRKK